MQPLLLLFTAVAGVLAATQSGSNSTLAKAIGPVTAGLASLAVSAVSLTVLGLVIGKLEWPGVEKIASVPWWAWLGGVMGATVLSAQLFAAQQLGSAVFAAITVTASIAASLALDHYGLLGFKQHSISWLRAAGALLMVAGVGAIARG